ncbi:MAG: hypothetical protein WA001_02025 [Patescibacteria group bacterium]
MKPEDRTALYIAAAIAAFAIAFGLLECSARAGELVLDPPSERVLLDRVVDGDSLYVWRERVGVRVVRLAYFNEYNRNRRVRSGARNPRFCYEPEQAVEELARLYYGTR